MGRKKRPAASLTTGPPPGVAQQPYGSYYPPQQPHSAHNLPPPLPPGPPSTSSNNNNNNNNNKKQKTNESYPVKKYRPSSSSYKAIEAFQRYTKTHRMTDASFTLISPPNRGATPSCPIVFSIIINGQSLSWGRGKNKDVAIDNACRAAFALVAAHGYDYELNDDCLTTEPMEVLNTALPPPPPPPPMMAGLPLPPGLPSGLPPMGLPPPPIGLQPPLPPTQPSAAAVLIPQPKAMDATLASASSVSGISTNHNNMNHNGTGVVGGNHNIIDGKKNITLSLENQNQHSSSLTSGITPIFKKKKIKDGLMLIYDAEQEIIDESGSGEKKIVIRSMEEQRSISDRYSKVMSLCWEKRRNDLQTNVV